jgi:hypothetical protein
MTLAVLEQLVEPADPLQPGRYRRSPGFEPRSWKARTSWPRRVAICLRQIVSVIGLPEP